MTALNGRTFAILLTPTSGARLKKLAEWLERDYPSAAASLIEGLEECFTINRLDVPASLHRCFAARVRNVDASRARRAMKTGLIVGTTMISRTDVTLVV